MPCVVYSGSVTITGTCFLVCDEDGQYWECDQSTLSWILDGAGIEMGNATYPYKGAFPLVVCGWDVEMNPSVHSIVAGSPADVELRKLLSRLEESHMLAHIEDAAASNPKYLAFVVERAEAKQRVASARSALAEAEYILRNPPHPAEDEGDAERRFLSRGDDAREAAFDANRPQWDEGDRD